MSRCLVFLALVLILADHAFAQEYEIRTIPPPKEANCSANEEYSYCGKLCEPTCVNSDIRSSSLCSILNIFSWLCVPQLVGGCRCNPGFTRNGENDCVRCDSV